MSSWGSYEVGKVDCSAINEGGECPDADTSIKNHDTKEHFALWRIGGEGHHSEDVVLQDDFAMTSQAACSIAANFDCGDNIKDLPPTGRMQLTLGLGKLCGF